MRRYAFIDVANTKGSAKILNFNFDPEKLFNYLSFDKWSCEKVFWYNGRIRNNKNEKQRKKIEKIGYVIQDKETHFFKKEYSVNMTCPECQKQTTQKITKQRYPKANCDVELTVDCLELAGNDVEFLVFTGDGDFRYLFETLSKKGANVRLFSTNKKDLNGDYRLSTRLKDLLRQYEGTWLFFTELDNIKNRIKKETATKA